MRQIMRSLDVPARLGWLLILAAVAGGIDCARAESIAREVARAYTRDGSALLYSETHWRYREQGFGRRLVVYRCPDGSAFARKTVLDRPSATAPDFEFVDARSGYREGVRSRDGRREVFVQASASAAERSRPLPVRVDGIIDAGFDAGVRQHWSALGSEGMRLWFLIPERFDYVPLRLLASDGEERGVRHLRMTLDRWFGFVAPSIELSYAASDQRLIEFAGPGTVRDDRGRSREVRIVFADAASPVDAQALQREAALPLSGRCRI